MIRLSKAVSFAVLAAAFSLGGCRTQAEPPQAIIKAPNFTLTDLSGKKFSLSDYKGKVVFIDFWATWCPPCVVSIPEVQKLEEEYKDKGLVVLSLSLDTTEEPVRGFVARAKMKSRVALVGDSGADVDYAVQGIPSFFLIDKNGNLAGSWGGYSSRVPPSWRKELDKVFGL